MIFIKKIFFRYVYVALIIASQNYSATAQGFNLDSFRTSVNLLHSDSEKIKFIIERAAAFPCEDSSYSLALAKDAKQMSKKIKWNNGVYGANRVIGDVLFECQKNVAKGIDVLQESIALAEKEGDIFSEANSLENLAKKCAKYDLYDKSIDNFRRALALDVGPDLKMAILGEMGLVYSSLGDYPNSIVYYDSALKQLDQAIAKKANRDAFDTLIRLGLKVNMADICLIMPNLPKAITIYSEVLAVGRAIDNKRFIELSYIGLGRAFMAQKKYGTAIENFQLGLNECMALSNSGTSNSARPSGKASCSPFNNFEDEDILLNEMANAYLDSGVTKLAKNYADSALSLADRQHFIKMLSKTNTTYGRVLLKESHPELAIAFLRKALGFSYENRSFSDRKDAWLGLYEAYKQGGQFQQALDAYTSYVATRDSAQKIEKTNEAMRTDLEIANREERLKQRNDYEKAIERSHYLTIGGFSGLALVLALAFFMYRSYKIQRTLNSLLSKEKQGHLAHIQAQSDVLSDIAHIQAHEVRGPVSAIMGFVQIFNFEDPADPNNKQVMEWIGVTAEKLDNVVRSVVSKENELRSEHEHEESKAVS